MTGSHLQVRLAPVKCRECIVWENEAKGGQKYLTVQMNGERYSVWDSKYFDTIREGTTVDYDPKQSGNFTHLIDVEPARSGVSPCFKL